MVTVGDLLRLTVLKEAHILAGADGLMRQVNYIDVIEVPDIVNWAKPGTVYLTTTYPFMDNAELLIQTVQGFVEHDVSALMLKIGRFIEEVPAEVYQIANTHKLPIIVLPTDAAYSPIITAIGRKLSEEMLDEQDGYNDFAFQQRLQGVLVNDGGIHALVELLADQLGGEVFVENTVGQMIYSAGVESFVKIYQSKKWLEQEPAYFREMAYYGDFYYTAFIMPAYLGDEMQGSIVVLLKGEVAANEAFFWPIKRVASVIALELSREKAVCERRIQLEQALLEEIIERGEALDEGATLQRMVALGWEYTELQQVAVFNISRKEDFNDRQKFEQHIQKVSYRLTTHIKKAAFGGIFCRKGDNLVCLFGMPKAIAEPQEQLITWCETILSDLAQDFQEIIVTVGVSRLVKRIDQMGNAYGDAQKAVRIGKRAYGTGKVYDYQKMGVYRLLFTHKDVDSMVEFYEDYLAPLVQYDQKHSSDLVHTLETYYQNNTNTLATAEQLYIHRNTLHYRMKRASETLGFDVDDVERKLCVSLALQIKKFLDL